MTKVSLRFNIPCSVIHLFQQKVHHCQFQVSYVGYDKKNLKCDVTWSLSSSCHKLSHFPGAWRSFWTASDMCHSLFTEIRLQPKINMPQFYKLLKSWAYLYHCSWTGNNWIDLIQYKMNKCFAPTSNFALPGHNHETILGVGWLKQEKEPF